MLSSAALWCFLLASFSAASPTIPSNLLISRAAPFPVPLTVCCIGDSITSGIGSTGDNEGDAYRRYLYDLITQGGTSATFVGKQTGQYSVSGGGVAAVTSPNFPQPDNEAAGGYRINQIIDLLEQDGTIPAEQPNLVLIHAGTNDNDLQFVYQDEPQPNTQTCTGYSCVGNAHPSETWADAPNRLGNLIDYVLCNDPDAVVLVAVLIQNYANATQGNLFNQAVPDVVAERYEKGFKVRVVDMSSIYPSDDNALHPLNEGYQEMANRWYAAMLDIPSSWWSSSKSKKSKRSDTLAMTSEMKNVKRAGSGSMETCDRNSISFTAALDGANVATGWHVASDPGAGPSTPLTSGDSSSSSSGGSGKQWIPQWGNDGDIAIGTGYPGSGVRLADLDGDGRADYLWVNTSDASFRAWLNGGKDAWNAINNAQEVLWGTGSPDFVEFADLNGDKRVEYIVVQNGAFRVFMNEGANGNIWNFKESTEAGQHLSNAFGSSGPGFHYFGDLNGDGRADLAILQSNGVINFYIQSGGGIDSDSFSWTPCLNHAELAGTMDLVDIDGDGRADYVSMAEDGSLSGWLNQPGGSCDITWVPINGRGPDSLAFGKGVPASQVRLADMDGDGKADYLTVSNDTGELNSYPNIGYYGTATTQASTSGSGGIGGYGAAVRLADINADGLDDYLSVDDITGVLAYLNEGQQGSSWSWEEQNNGVVIALGYSGATRSEIQFADMNGDGYEDFVFINASTGALSCYLNYGPTDKGYSFKVVGEIAIGVGGIGAGVRLADMNGDGKADYIYLDDAGAARVWINAGGEQELEQWTVLNNGADAAIGVGANRQDVHFADIDGDGLADYIWVHPEDGSVNVWYNDGPLGSALGWISGGTIQPGVGVASEDIRFARIGTSGRADIVALAEDGSFKAWLSTCSKVTGSKARVGAAGSGGSGGQCSPTPPMSTQSVPEAPFSAALSAGCIASPCTLCYGSGCGVCRGACGTCSGSGCGGCKGDDCHVCIGTDCDGCHGYDCSVCSGTDCSTTSCQGSDCGAQSHTTTPPATRTIPTTATARKTVYQSGTVFNDQPGVGGIFTYPTSGCMVVEEQRTTITEAYPQTTEYNTIPAGPVCLCATSEIVGVDPSTNGDGTVFLYCATGLSTFATSNAIATATAGPNEPGNPDNPDWAQVSCDYGSLQSRYNNRTQQWDDAGASAAWQAVVQAWDEQDVDKHTSLNFSDFATDYFHSAITNCGELGDGTVGCNDFISCGQSGRNGAVSAPAGYIITNSFVAIHAILNVFYANIASAELLFGGEQLGAFNDKFGAVAQNIEATEKANAALKKKYETALLVLSIVLNFSFSVAFKEIGNLGKGLTSNLLSAIGSSLYGEISDAFSYDELSLETQNILYTQNSLELYTSFVFERWQNATQTIASNVFNSTDALGGLINNGAYFAVPDQVTSFNETQTLVAALYANLLPIVWHGGPYLGQPVILTNYEDACDDNFFSPFTAQLGDYPGYGQQSSDDGAPIIYHIDNSDLATQTCFISGGKAYYLAWTYLYNPNNLGEIVVHFGIPPGPPSAINGTAGLYGGLDISEVTDNAVNSWIAGNFSNNFDQQIPLSTIQDLFQLDSTAIANAPGLVQIPVCSGLDVALTLAADTFAQNNNSAWPCETGQGFVPYGEYAQEGNGAYHTDY